MTLADQYPCRRVPRGWVCRLPRHHDGPCPAWPTLTTRIRYALRGRRLPR